MLRRSRRNLSATITRLLPSHLVLTLCMVLFPAMASDALSQTFDDPLFVSEGVTSLLPYRLAGFTWAPDGRLFIWTKDGVIRIFKNGVLLPTPFIDLRTHVNVAKDRGLS